MPPAGRAANSSASCELMPGPPGVVTDIRTPICRQILSMVLSLRNVPAMMTPLIWQGAAEVTIGLELTIIAPRSVSMMPRMTLSVVVCSNRLLVGPRLSLGKSRREIFPPSSPS